MAGVRTKLVDGCKYREYLLKNNLKSSHICIKAGLNHSYANNTTAMSHSEDGEGHRCRVNEVYWNLICDAMEVPRDYFDAKEPEPIKEEKPEGELKEEQPECLVDLADIQVSLKKIELLLMEQNKLLRGKLEKGERTNEVKGSTNSGSPHSFTIAAVRDLH